MSLIFVVNDHELQRKLQADLIESALEEEARTFDDGTALLGWYDARLKLPEGKRHLPSCIVLNNFMLELHGPETLLRLRKMEHEHGLRRTPVIATSTMFGDGDRKVFERHADAMLDVPFSVPEFLATLRRLLPQA